MDIVDKDTMKKHFGRNSSTYDKYAQIQRKMAIKLIDLIKKDINKADELNVLDVGCGTGILTKLFLEEYSNSKVTAVDIAPGMIKMAKNTLADYNVNFICDDIEKWQLENEYDLIISNTAFEWFSDSKGTFENIMKMLKVGGRMCFSTFGNSTFSELQQSFNEVKGELEPELYVAPGQQLYSMEQLYQMYTSILENYPDVDVLINCKETLEYEYFNTVKDFLKSAEKLGLNNSNRLKNTSATLIKQMADLYEKNYTYKEKIRATYHCIYFSLKVEITEKIATIH